MATDYFGEPTLWDTLKYWLDKGAMVLMFILIAYAIIICIIDLRIRIHSLATRFRQFWSERS